MGERKGTNKYYPPDYDPRKGGLNRYLGTHALRERARKIHMGVIIIRFEMPYNIWCGKCDHHIGMGVRYNAEKKKIGMYYTTPLYQFRMKCHLCDNYFEIQTDPSNLEYVIVSGARRQEKRWNPADNEQVVPETKETQKKLFDDAMYKLEHGAEDVAAATEAKPRLAQLYNRNDVTWNDDFAANQLLRKEFREKRKQMHAQAEMDKQLLKKSSLDIKLLPENEEDRKLGALMMLNPVNDVSESSMKRIEAVISEPALAPTSVNNKRKRMSQSLDIGALGIVRKNQKGVESEKKDSEAAGRNDQACVPNSTVTSDMSNTVPNVENEASTSEHINMRSTSTTAGIGQSSAKNNEKMVLKISSLVCDYGSSSSTSDSDN